MGTAASGLGTSPLISWPEIDPEPSDLMKSAERFTPVASIALMSPVGYR